jgi:uncharacterized protein
MRALLDVNMLVAMHDPAHAHHRLTLEWIEANVHHGLASCPITQNGCLRVLTQPAYPRPAPFGEVLQRLGKLHGAPSHEFWADDISLLDGHRLRVDRALGHRQLTDVYLLALAVHHHGRLVTFDAKIPTSVVVGASAKHLVTLLAP